MGMERFLLMGILYQTASRRRHDRLLTSHLPMATLTPVFTPLPANWEREKRALVARLNVTVESA